MKGIIVQCIFFYFLILQLFLCLKTLNHGSYA